MRYIRTEDGRIIGVDAVTLVEGEKTNRYHKDYILDKIENVDGKCYLHWTAAETRGDHYIEQIGFGVYIDSPFIKQSDEIEELFDEKVIAIDGQRPIIANICNLDEFKGSSFSNAKYYGAIWTDEGLIYVAKMNDKGEFELLKKEGK